MRTADSTPGHLYAVDSRNAARKVVLYPSDSIRIRRAAAVYPNCKTPPSSSTFSPHGINYRRDPNGGYDLLVVEHGDREAVEVFHLDVLANSVRTSWIGCVLLPDGDYGNGVASLPRGGFVVSNMYNLRDPSFLEKFATGQATGTVLRWSSRSGWTDAIKTTLSGANGVETTQDGHWLYVSEWSGHRVWKIALDGSEDQHSTSVNFLPDNLRWTGDGRLLLAGQNSSPEEVFGCEARHQPCPLGFTVAELNKDTLKARVLVVGGSDSFGGATGAAYVDQELWVGSFRSDKIARYAHHASSEGK